MNPDASDLSPNIRRAMERPATLKQPTGKQVKSCSEKTQPAPRAEVGEVLTSSRVPASKAVAGSNPQANRSVRNTSEASMQDEIESFCRVKGWPAYRSRMDRKTSMPVGTPDFLVCVPNQSHEGLFVGIECKAPPNKPTPEQWNHIRQIIKQGGRAIVAESSKEAIDFLIQTHQEL